MKKWLFLDDDQNRHDRLDQMISVLNLFDKVEIYHAMRSSVCITKLKEEVWDALFLDHDLDYTNMYNAPFDIQTGMDVVDYIDRVMDRDRCPRNIIIHSHNKAAAVLMENNLKIAGISSTITRIEFPSWFAHIDKEFLDLLVELIKE